MKTPNVKGWILITMLIIPYSRMHAQTCPPFSNTIINSGNLSAAGNTYFPGTTATVNAGSTSLNLGPAGYGSTAISASDVLLIIQMQGAQINSNNGTTYGSNGTTGRGYLNNAQLMAGNMEYIVASNAVSVAGGTLTLKSALTKSYKNSAFGTYGQYSYQVIRVPLYYNISLTTDITVPRWNGSTGGVLVLSATNNLTMNGNQINATGAGFRGGGGKKFSGGSGAYTDYRAVSTAGDGASKGEGIAGTPRYINSNGTMLDYGTGLEGYPNGSFDRGSPGNAGGGGTDGQPSSNSNNSGGGGGSNGGTGGGGGNSWNSNRSVGGIGAVPFAQASPSRLVMGGGGGAGSTDGGTGTPGNGFASSGTAGGGIVILNLGGNVLGTGIINANGDAPNTTLQNDGGGGSGAGGSVLIIAGGDLTGLEVHADGGDGASNTGGAVGPSPHGPGGGGGGGIIYSTGALNASSSADGGAAGTTVGGSNYGATAGTAGLMQVTTASSTPIFPVSCTVLAANFLSTSVSSKNNNNILYWTVADNETVQQYNIERSADGIGFVSIATILPQSTGDNNTTYQYIDADAGTRISGPQLYYRIKLAEAGGNVSYSKVMQVKSSLPTNGLTLTPNPVSDLTTLYFLADNPAAISVQVIDLKGKSVWKNKYSAGVGMNMLQLNNLQALPDGVYIVNVSNGRQVQSIKMLVRH